MFGVGVKVWGGVSVLVLILEDHWVHLHKMKIEKMRVKNFVRSFLKTGAKREARERRFSFQEMGIVKSSKVGVSLAP